VPLVEKELLTLPEYLSWPGVFSGVRVTRSLVLCVCFVDRCLSFCTFYVSHCVVCSSIYGFWLPLLYLQALLCRFKAGKWVSFHFQWKLHILSPLVCFNGIANWILNPVIFPAKIQISKTINVPYIRVFVWFKNDKHVISM
jgi:hypothetical protein